MRNFGQTGRRRKTAPPEEDEIPDEYINLGVLGTALTTQGILGAGVGLVVGVVGVSLFEALTRREIDAAAQNILVGGSALAFAAGIPAGLLSLEGRL